MYDPKLIDQLGSLESPMTLLALTGLKTMLKVLPELDKATRLKIVPCPVIDLCSNEEEVDPRMKDGSEEEAVSEEEIEPEEESTLEYPLQDQRLILKRNQI